MSTGLIIAIVIAALILLALFWFLGKKGREKRLDTRRDQAREIQREADVGRAQADKTRAEAEAQAAEAQRQDALARERSATAEEQRAEARERQIDAAKKDPDADPDEAAERFDREQPQGMTGGGTTGGTTTGGTAATAGTGDVDRGVEHYEHTSEPGTERERRFERDAEGEVVRDDEVERPRQ